LSALPNLCISVTAPVTALARVKPALRIRWLEDVFTFSPVPAIPSWKQDHSLLEWLHSL
jgi:hypothetical protein